MSNTSHSITSNIELQEELSFDLERLELQFGHRLAQSALFGLIALPLIPGLLTMISIGVHFPSLLGIHWAVAWGLGIVSMVGIEVLGLFSIRLALRMRKFNHKAAGRPVEHAPIGQGYTAAGVYLLSVLSLTLLLKIFPDQAVWALIPLCLMGALADWIFALNGDHNEREAALRKLVLEEQRSVQQAAEANALREQIDALHSALAEQSQRLELTTAALRAVQSECTALTTMNAEIVQAREQLREHLAALQAVHTEHEQHTQCWLDERADLLSSLAERDQAIGQQRMELNTLYAQLKQLTEHSVDTRAVQPVTIPPIQIVQPTEQKVYTNGHIADDLDHLELPDKIRVLAQRMKDTSVGLNKSKIADLLNCSRTTVAKVLDNDKPASK